MDAGGRHTKHTNTLIVLILNTVMYIVKTLYRSKTAQDILNTRGRNLQTAWISGKFKSMKIIMESILKITIYLQLIRVEGLFFK